MVDAEEGGGMENKDASVTKRARGVGGKKKSNGDHEGTGELLKCSDGDPAGEKGEEALVVGGKGGNAMVVADTRAGDKPTDASVGSSAPVEAEPEEPPPVLVEQQ